MKDIEKTKTFKADLVSAINDAVAYCNKAYDSMTDAKGSEMVKFFRFQPGETHSALAEHRTHR